MTASPTRPDEDIDVNGSSSAARASFLRPAAALLTVAALVGLMVVAQQPSAVSDTYRGSSMLSTNSNPTRYSTFSESQAASLFEEFKVKYSRKYNDDAEEQLRYANFRSFLKIVDTRNVGEANSNKAGTNVHGVTKFADWSQEEFQTSAICASKRRRLSFRKREAFIKGKYEPTGAVEGDTTDDDDDFVNWAGVYTTAVKDQGVCGSCWAFSAVEQIESNSIMDGYLTTSDELSVQQVVSCDTTDYGCDGGDVDTALEYVYDAGGLELADEYPYTSGDLGVQGTCNVDTGFFVVTATGFTLVESESAMEEYVWNSGPLSVCLDATTWSSYSTGIVSSSDCDTGDINHCVQIVGLNKAEEYWIVRNSWGTDWGQEGYIYVSTDGNTCDIEYSPLYTEVEQV
jgi:C1A family cysteine protease